MKILAVNCGSSSLKFQLYEMPSETVLISGTFERIGLEDGFYTLKLNGEKIKKEAKLPNHEEAVNIIVRELLDNQVITVLNEIDGVGHRVVNGGSHFTASVVLTEEVIKEIENHIDLAPIHNPANLIGITTFMKKVPTAKQVAVFDTAFHQTMPPESYLYPIAYEAYQNYEIRRYGFHGTSYRYVTNRINEILGRNDTRLIICHIGSGASICAVKNGKSVNTSMGFSPNSGLMMGSRSGDIDTTIIPFLMKKTGKTLDTIMDELSKKSGFFGITGVSDHRDVEEEINKGNEKAALAEKMFINSITKYIAQYYVELGGCDAICFTAGIGERASLVRKEVIDKLAVFGVKLDEKANEEAFGTEGLITSPISYIPCYVIPTDEEVMIARDTYAFIK